uniref:UBX domain-containing protein 4 n=1 Tax=Parastrongyloides trichosuri TaxID=131310 RepID=A0A0N4ZU28_PARTI
MVWFEGSVADAVSKCKADKALFIVYLHHKFESNNPETSRMEELWTLLDPSFFEVPYVGIKVEENTLPAQQFSSIYKNPICPSVYFIGSDAKPIEIISLIEELDDSMFVDRVSNAFKKFAVDNGYVETMWSGMTKEEKVLHAQKLIKEKKAKKEEMAIIEAKEKELRRRNEGKAMLEAKEKARELELKEAAAAIKRQKEEDMAYKKRILEQMALERKEKQLEEERRRGLVTEEKSKPVVPKSTPIPTDSCRVQIRFHDGKTLVKEFPSSDKLQVLKEAIINEKKLTTDFAIIQAYPRKELTEFDKTFLDLELTPSAAVLVIPSEGKVSLPLIRSKSAHTIIQTYILAPMIIILNFIRSFLGLSSITSNNVVQNESSPTLTGTENISNNESNEDESNVRQRGNIRFLRNSRGDRSDDDRTETFNGNSTSQL